MIDERADTSPEIAAAVAQIMASRYQPQVGDRVRVTGAIAECRVTYGVGTLGAVKGLQPGHMAWELGATGVVVRRAAPTIAADQGHTVVVRWDHPPVEEISARAGCYAPSELEPLP